MSIFSVSRWPDMDRGAQRTLLLSVALPLIAVTALGIAFGFEQVKRYQQELLKSDLELIARAIRIPVGEALARDDPDGVRVALQSIFTIDRVYGASVFDREGNRIASGGIAERDLSSSRIPGIIETTGEKQEAYREVDGRVVFSHFLPLFDRAGQSKGFIQITRRLDDFSDSLWRVTWVSWSLWALLAVSIVIVVILGYRGGLGRHVNHLVKVMADFAGGDRRQRASVEGPREVVAIASGLNEMLDSIERYQQELEDRRRAEQDLTARLKEQEKMAAIGGMARGIAHELGAPLSVIDGRARRLQRQLPDDRDASGAELKEIRQQVRYLTDSVNQLMEFSRHGLTRRAFDLRDLIRRLEQVHAAEAQERGISVHSRLSDGVPTMRGDPDRLQLALSCILRNALQAAGRRVDLTLTVGESGCAIEIQDDGPGLPENASVDRLKDPFFTTRPSGEGTGLGLAIANNIVSEHGGTIEIGDRENGGCRVLVSLPMTAAG